MAPERICTGSNPFKEALQQKEGFIYTLELVPGRGSRGKSQDQVLTLAEKAIKGGLVHAVSITDNPGGHPALSPDVIGLEICRMGMNPIIHFTCKDKNRNQIESILHALERTGVQNLLVMTGDYPLYGFEGKAKPVYDLDSLQLLHLINQMNLGLDVNGHAPGGGVRLPPSHFFKGCTVSPFKRHESEVMVQYYKLYKKVRMGADYVISQVGFDVRKLDELRRYLNQSGLRVPVLGNVYILNLSVARVMNRRGVPGCVVTDDLFRTMEEEVKGADKGKEASLSRAAKLIAILKGIGFDGAHIGGPNLRYEDLEWVIGKSREHEGDWLDLVAQFTFPQKDGFYLFEKNEKTGLNSDSPSRPGELVRKRFGHAVMRAFHRIAFAEDARLFSLAQWLCRKIDGSDLEAPLTEFEYWIKFLSSRCRRCGDCTLPEVAFLCPQSQCPKFLFTGQCGGSVDDGARFSPARGVASMSGPTNASKPMANRRL